jgi:hypothetical protein
MDAVAGIMLKNIVTTELFFCTVYGKNVCINKL